jgi:hypothetical protein
MVSALMDPRYKAVEEKLLGLEKQQLGGQGRL